jgi:Tfp pilus assembly protein PilO
MVFTKKITKAPAVMVETKKLSAKDTCGIPCCGKIKHLVISILVVINTLMLCFVLFNQTKLEADKVGGRDNYKMVQQIYTSDAFKAAQQQQIQQALQMYQGDTQTVQQLPVTATGDTMVTQ